MTIPMRDLCREFRIDPAILERRHLWSGPIDNHFEGWAPPQEFFTGRYHEGSKKGRAFSRSGAYTGIHSQFVLGRDHPMVIITLSRQHWTIEIAPYAQEWDGMFPVAFRPLKGRSVVEAWEYRRGAPPDAAGCELVAKAITRASRARRATFLTCEGCELKFPPESIFERRFCSSCAPGLSGEVAIDRASRVIGEISERDSRPQRELPVTQPNDPPTMR